MNEASIDLSIIVPLLNEEDSLAELAEWIKRVCNAESLSYEIIFIDDGSTDRSWSVIETLASSNKQVKGISFRRNYGKSAALQVGFNHCKGEVVITMDADLQDSPDEIPSLRQMILEEGLDIVSGWKKKRYDPITKTIPTKLFNWATRKLSGIYLNDFNCGLKAYRKEVVKSIEVYGEMHRYIPVIAKWGGFKKIGEKEVIHQPRKYGHTKFGLERFINGFLDLLSITFVSKFSKRPMHFFGSLGTLTFVLGLISAMYLGGIKLWGTFHGVSMPKVTELPYFYLSLTCMVLGTQLFLAGFLAEMVARNAPDRNSYKEKDRIGL
jgi:glycosyltransferase involved in cell wall biosynthesis